MHICMSTCYLRIGYMSSWLRELIAPEQEKAIEIRNILCIFRSGGQR